MSEGTPYAPYLPLDEKTFSKKKESMRFSVGFIPAGAFATSTNAESGSDNALDSILELVLRSGQGASNEIITGVVPSGVSNSLVKLDLSRPDDCKASGSRKTTPVNGLVFPSPPTPPSNAFASVAIMYGGRDKNEAIAKN